MEFKIEKGVEIPTDNPGRGRNSRRYPFHDMAVGDSFFVPCDAREVRSVQSAGRNHTRRHGHAFITRRRTEDGVEGVRFWRVE